MIASAVGPQPAAPLRLDLPAAPETVPFVRHRLRDYLRQLGVASGRSHEIETAVTEAVKNAIEHGFPDRGGGSLVVSAETLVPETVEVTVADDGDGMHPDLESDGLGLGLGIIGKVAAAVDITQAQPHGTVVTMQFRLGGV